MKDITIVPDDFIITHKKTDFVETVTIDNEVRYAVERTYTKLVYCKDCKYYTINSEYEWRDGIKSIECSLHCPTHTVKPTDYCSYAERK